MEKAQTIATQKGDRLLDLVRRVYQIRDQDRILAAAMAVTAFTPSNQATLHNRFNQPLDAGISIEFPPWSVVEQHIKQADARKSQLAAQVVAKPTSNLAIAPTRQVGIARQAPLGERTTTKEVQRAMGLSATQAANELKPLTAEEIDPSRTRSPVAAKVSDYGKAVADNCPRQALSELFQQSEKAFTQSWEIVVRGLNPRGFPPNVDIAPTISALHAGFFMAFSQRLVREAKEEIARRHRLLGRVLARPEAKERTNASAASSRAFAEFSGENILNELQRHAQGEAPDGVPGGVLEQLRKQYGVAGSPSEPKIFLPPGTTTSAYLAFLDQFHAGGTDGTLSQTLLDLGTRVSDAHKQAVQAALGWLEGQVVDPKLGPNEALAKVLNEVLKKMRGSRASLPAEAQNRQLADERHLLSGRNFLSFRKDVSQGLDRRLTMAAQLSPEQRTAVLLALLIQDGHRLTTLRQEEIDGACDRFVQAAP